MVIRVEQLSVRLGKRTVVDAIDAEFTGGALVGIVGPNGAGKSSLVRALLGLIPAEGRIEIDGVALSAIPREQIARRIAYLPQGQTLHWPLSVARLVALGRLPHLGPFSKLTNGDRAAVARAMAAADVTDLAPRIVTELSGGERARVLIARALAVEAPTLIVDEPLASLDPAHQLQVMELLRAEADRGALVIAVQHDLGLAGRFCDRVLVLNHGALMADGVPAMVLTPRQLEDTYGICAWVGEAEGTRMIVPLHRSR